MPSPKATTAATPEKWYTIRAQARPAAGVNAQARAEILIYGDIGESWYGDTVAAKDFVREVSLLDVDALTVRINSYGGSVTDGVAIYNALKRHPAAVTTVIDGIAASIASLIAMAGDTVEMADNAMLMIHAPWMYTGGNSASLREDANMLDSYAEAMATSYIAKTGGDKAEILALLQDGKDHWYTAEEAISAKFADAAITALPLAASASLNPPSPRRRMPCHNHLIRKPWSRPLPLLPPSRSPLLRWKPIKPVAPPSAQLSPNSPRLKVSAPWRRPAPMILNARSKRPTPNCWRIWALAPVRRAAAAS